MKKHHWNFLIDALLLLLTAVMTGKGLLLKYVLIPGRDRHAVYGSNVGLEMFGLDRHEWGMIHLYVGYAMIALVMLHIILHWNLIPGMFRKLIAWRGLRWAGGTSYVALCLFLVFFPFIIQPAIVEGGEGEGGGGGGKGYGRGKGAQKQTETVAKRGLAPGVSQPVPVPGLPPAEESEANHDEGGKSSGVKGYMTLGEAAKQYGVSADDLASALGITEKVSADTRLGQLRQRHNFTMQDVEKAAAGLKKR